MLELLTTASGKIFDSITYVQRMVSLMNQIIMFIIILIYSFIIMQQRRPTISPDLVVDISDMYCMTLKKEDVSPNYFTTCQSHKLTLEIQEFMFAQLWESNSFWVCYITLNNIDDYNHMKKKESYNMMFVFN